MATKYTNTSIFFIIQFISSSNPHKELNRILKWIESWERYSGSGIRTLNCTCFSQHNLDVSSEAVPVPVRCSEERLADSGVFLLENGHSMFLWLGQASPPDLVQGLFNLPSLAHLQGHMVRIPLVVLQMKQCFLFGVIRWHGLSFPCLQELHYVRGNSGSFQYALESQMLFWEMKSAPHNSENISFVQK